MRTEENAEESLYDISTGKDIELYSKEPMITDVMTGDRNRNRYLYYQLKMSISKADSIDIIVSFLMESGVKLILNDLKTALERGVKIRILTGNYLGITQPSALYLIKKECGNAIDLRFYNDKSRSFHPKSYIFHYNGMNEIYIGSSNISRSALTSGIEWNYRFNSLNDSKNYNTFYNTFEELFLRHSIKIDDAVLSEYSRNWHKPAVSKDLARYDENELNADLDKFSEKMSVQDLDDKAENIVRELFEPRGAQIEALYALENSRKEGVKKGLINAATGVGKTYLAAFDSKNYKKVLFVAHREEILRQAAQSFRNVRNSDDYGFFFGKQKETDKSVIFASVATLGKKEYLTENYFSRDYFDYIVVDEFHHAVNEQYRRIVEYFKPKFLLGLTATPERMDGRNIYELCDYNVPYEISLKEAINRGILVPFRYYGIYDETDYSGLHIVGGKYNENELTELYKVSVKRYELIYKYYKKYNSKRALGFCCSKKHAQRMAEEFCKKGIKAVAVYSGEAEEYTMSRNEAIEKIKCGEINVIFSVDMFNEGVDIASLDMVMFLRPTESQVVFLQQLGRGLRTFKGKNYLTVLDFIGNYEKAGKTPLLLSGEKSFGSDKDILHDRIEYPDDCIVDFDMRLIDMFSELEKRTVSVKERINREYFRVKEFVGGHVPSRMELFTYMETNMYEYCLSHTKQSPFRNYIEYLNGIDELSQDEKKLYKTIGFEFLSMIETTSMTKIYKMPLLYSFYNDGVVLMEVGEQHVLKCWKNFFGTNRNWRDLPNVMTYEKYKKITDKEHLNNIKKNPAKYLRESGKGFFVGKDGSVLALNDELKDVIKEEVFRKHMKDILDYRTMDYYRKRYTK